MSTNDVVGFEQPGPSVEQTLVPGLRKFTSRYQYFATLKLYSVISEGTLRYRCLRYRETAGSIRTATVYGVCSAGKQC